MGSLVKRFSYISFLAVFSILFSCSSLGTTSRKAEAAPPSIIPLPSEVRWGDNEFLLTAENIICTSGGAETAAQWLKELLKSAGKDAEITTGDACGNFRINMDSSLEKELGEEGYLLDINEEAVTITAAQNAGLFYGIQSLRQMFPAEIEKGSLAGEIFLREVSIQDKPAYSWRGSMVDVARSFFGPEYLKRHIDRMALYKMNRLHLHLTDDQGWRIEIKSKPKLTEVGSKGSVTGGNSGFLSQEEYKEIQEYALARNIILIPEIDMPGHIYSALVSYPELNCDENANINPQLAIPPDLYPGYEVGWSRFCLDKPETYEFVTDVLQELVNITKGPWIHIGGDEIEDTLYEDFVVKADSIVRQMGKTSIGWEEVTKAEVSDSMISQQWHGKAKSVVDAPVIASICSSFYLDHANYPGQPNTLNWCKEDGVSLENVYSFTTDNPKVIGVEAPVWTEHVLNNEMMDDRFWPRLIAVAEVGWTRDELRNFTNFKDRLQAHGLRLQKMGIHFHPTPGIDWGTREISEESTSVFSSYTPQVR